MNRRAIRALERLARRYAADRSPPSLRDVEAALWQAGEVADRRLGGYSPRRSFSLITSNIENWTSHNLGWSFPCAEAVNLIRRLVDWPSGRIIDIGAGAGLWTRILKREFGADKVIGLDPSPNGDHIVKATFGDWCEMTGGPANTDLLFASWLPCRGQEGCNLGPQILDKVTGEEQMFVYVGSGPNGAVGTREFYDRLAAEFEEYATEPLPRVYRAVFPRDFIRAYRPKPSLAAESKPRPSVTSNERSVCRGCPPPSNGQTA